MVNWLMAVLMSIGMFFIALSLWVDSQKDRQLDFIKSEYKQIISYYNKCGKLSWFSVLENSQWLLQIQCFSWKRDDYLIDHVESMFVYDIKE